MRKFAIFALLVLSVRQVNLAKKRKKKISIGILLGGSANF